MKIKHNTHKTIQRGTKGLFRLLREGRKPKPVKAVAAE